MKGFFSLLLLTALVTTTACHHSNHDEVVAQVYYHKLYLSQIREILPKGLCESDSIAITNDIIDNWIRKQLILREAERYLTAKEKNFDNALKEYRNSLLINAYYDKLIKDTVHFNISDSQIQDFTRDFDKYYTVNKAIVKVNYVKLPKHSRLIAPVKAILFDENLRQTKKEELVSMLGDSIEYFVDDAWFYLSDIAGDLPVDPDDSVTLENKTKCIEKTDRDFHYLIVLSDYKSQRSATVTTEELAAARMMLLQQKKRKYIDRHIDELYNKAVENGIVVQ